MGKTVKAEWSKPDGWHMMHRLERKARPAGRLVAVIDRELDENVDEGADLVITFEPVVEEVEQEFFCCSDCDGWYIDRREA